MISRNGRVRAAELSLTLALALAMGAPRASAQQPDAGTPAPTGAGAGGTQPAAGAGAGAGAGVTASGTAGATGAGATTTTMQEGGGGAELSPGGASPAAGPSAETEPPAAAVGGSEIDAAGSPTHGAIVQEDVAPTISAIHTEDFELRLGGLVQVHGAWVGEDALIANGDPATRPGFRLRRARFGIEASFRYDLGLLLVLDALGEGDGTVVSDAKLTWHPIPELLLSVGSGKVPFSRAALESSRHLTTVERPITVQGIAPDRRLGITAEGDVLGGILAYLVGVTNGTDGFPLGNQFGGYLVAGRLEVRPWGRPDVRHPEQDGIAVGGGAFYENGPATNGFAWSADLLFAIFRAFLKVEGMCETRTPDEAPLVAPGIADELTRCGGYAEAGYTLPFLPWLPIQPVLRAEIYDDNTAVDDAGDALLIGGGVNVQVLDPYARVQLHYLARRERYGEERDNDSLVLVMQGTF